MIDMGNYEEMGEEGGGVEQAVQRETWVRL